MSTIVRTASSADGSVQAAAIPLRFVATTGSDSNHGRSTALPFRTIQAAVDALPSTGGTVFVLPHSTDTYSPFFSDKSNLVIEGLGATGLDTQTGTGLVRISVPSGQDGAALGLTASSHSHAGPVLRNLHFVGQPGANSGVRIKRFSNFLLDRVSVSDFTSVGSRGVYIEGENAAQYGEIRNLRAGDCLTGVEINDHNGVRMWGGFIEYLTAGTPTVQASSTGVKVNAASDNFRAYGVVTQFLETCYDISGEGANIDGARFEAFTTGVRFNGSRGVLGPGAMFNNSILGGASGQCVTITASAVRTRIHPFHYASVLPDAVSDSGTSTHRGDGIRIDKMLTATISATATEQVICLPTNLGAVDSYKVRYCEFQTGDTAITASATDYWTVILRKRGGSTNDVQTIDSQSGWTAFSRQAVNPAGAGGSDQTFVAGDRIHLALTKTGAPANLTGASIHLILVPR